MAVTDHCLAGRPALIVANGDPPSAELLTALLRPAPFVVAADGACATMMALGHVPDVVLGDLDSIAASTRASIPAGRLIETPDQNSCDLEKAIDWAVAAGAGAIALAGATGMRIDHTLTAISLLIRGAGAVPLRLVDEGTVVRAVEGSAIISGAAGATLSVIVFAGAPRLTLTGVRWELSDAPMAPGSRGVSNRMAGDTAQIRVTGGVVIATVEHGGEPWRP